jgi:hypothetical protein
MKPLLRCLDKRFDAARESSSAESMRTILSIQSHVVYGHVGNSAAVFPL